MTPSRVRNVPTTSAAIVLLPSRYFVEHERCRFLRRRYKDKIIGRRATLLNSRYRERGDGGIIVAPFGAQGPTVPAFPSSRRHVTEPAPSADAP